MNDLLRERLPEALKTIAPLVVAATVLQVTMVHAPAALFLQFILGAVLAAFGILLLLWGVELGILPMGRFIGAELPMKGSVRLIIAIAFALGPNGVSLEESLNTLATPGAVLLPGT